ncbi:MAG: hypothetical protein HGN29_14995 [Asgard group archaeon]|nr:hypothetical protein [Asgard group archaeon]
MNNKVGLFGTTSSGKTVYLVVLYEYLNKLKAELVLDFKNEEDSEAYLSGIAQDLYEKKVLPEMTDRRSIRKVAFNLSRQVKNTVETVFRMETYDFGGDTLLDIFAPNLDLSNNQIVEIPNENIPDENKPSEFINMKKTINSLIEESSSFMFMVDPNPIGRHKQDRFLAAILNQIIDTNQKKNRLKSNSVIENVSIAFVLTKSDLYYNNQHTERELNKLIPQSWKRAKKLYFVKDRVKSFYITSLGYNTKNETAEDGSKYAIVPDIIQPENIDEPLKWFKKQFADYRNRR